MGQRFAHRGVEGRLDTDRRLRYTHRVMPAETPSAAPHDKPISWRDIFDEILKSEERIKKAIQEAVKPICDDVNDHERRLREIEREGSSEAREVKRVADDLQTRVKGIEKRHTEQDAESIGRKSVFVMGGKTITAIGAIAGIASILADLAVRFLTSTPLP